MKLAYVDCESTGTDPFEHELWEIGIVVVHDDKVQEALWRWWPDMTTADPTSLWITSAYERLSATPDLPTWKSEVDDDRRDVAYWISAPGETVEPDGAPTGFVTQQEAGLAVGRVLSGAYLFGCVPSFDANFLNLWLRSMDLAPAWQYQLHDVEDVAAGKLGLSVPYASDQISKELELPGPNEFGGRHTAMGDARWARAVHEAALRPVAVEPKRKRTPKAVERPEVMVGEPDGAEVAPNVVEPLVVEPFPSGPTPVAEPPLEEDDDEVAQLKAALDEAERRRQERAGVAEPVQVEASTEAPEEAPAVPEPSQSDEALVPGMPAKGDTYPCHQCGDDVDGTQAQLSWLKNDHKIFCRTHHIERARL